MGIAKIWNPTPYHPAGDDADYFIQPLDIHKVKAGMKFRLFTGDNAKFVLRTDPNSDLVFYQGNDHGVSFDLIQEWIPCMHVDMRVFAPTGQVGTIISIQENGCCKVLMTGVLRPTLFHQTQLRPIVGRS